MRPSRFRFGIDSRRHNHFSIRVVERSVDIVSIGIMFDRGLHSFQGRVHILSEQLCQATRFCRGDCHAVLLPGPVDRGLQPGSFRMVPHGRINRLLFLLPLLLVVPKQNRLHAIDQRHLVLDWRWQAAALILRCLFFLCRIDFPGLQPNSLFG